MLAIFSKPTREIVISEPDVQLAFTETLHDYPALACLKCGQLRKPKQLNKDGTVTYGCPPDHVHHGNRYTWGIAPDGTLID